MPGLPDDAELGEGGFSTMPGFEPGRRVEQFGDFYRLAEHIAGRAWTATSEATGLTYMLSELDFRRMEPEDEDAEQAGMIAVLNNFAMLRVSS